MKKLYLISYDIVNDRKRTKAADTLKNYGYRVQKSVFECRLKPEVLAQLSAKLSGIIDKSTDSLLICPICEACAKQKRFTGIKIIDRNNEAFRVI
ncbi:MAG: CRISPR-associated endonuclease Cas2 [Deltaproteobacteria bacterium]|nr:MAG: CRISPR-associated endonuclease Cas2 [Deltaproteobacteria bacterium]